MTFLFISYLGRVSKDMAGPSKELDDTASLSSKISKPQDEEWDRILQDVIKPAFAATMFPPTCLSTYRVSGMCVTMVTFREQSSILTGVGTSFMLQESITQILVSSSSPHTYTIRIEPTRAITGRLKLTYTKRYATHCLL